MTIEPDRELNRRVTAKWETEGQLAVIYRMSDDTDRYTDILVFYAKDRDPNFQYDQTLELGEVLNTWMYKAIEYKESAIPSDAYLSVTFTWTKTEEEK